MHSCKIHLWYDRNLNSLLSAANKEHIWVVEELGENEISPRIDFLLQINELPLVLGLFLVWGGNPNFRIPKSGKWSRVRVPTETLLTYKMTIVLLFT